MATRPTEGATPADVWRAVLVVVFSLSQIAAGFVPPAVQLETTIAARSAATPTLITPAVYAFAIWGPLFLGCLVFAAVQAWPSKLTDPGFRRAGWYAAIAFAANTAWEIWVPFNDLTWASLAIITVIFIALLAAMEAEQGAPGPRRRVFAALAALAGWITVAAFVNVLSSAKVETAALLGVSEVTAAYALLGAAGGVAAVVTAWSRSLIYPLPVVWGLAAVVVARLSEGETAVAYAAAAACAPAAAAWLWNIWRRVRGLQAARPVPA